MLRAYFPGSIETHCVVQDFFFGEDLMLRRHDYSVNIAGGFAAAQLTSVHAEVNVIRLPTKRHAYTRGPDRRPILDMLMVSIDISDVNFSTSRLNTSLNESTSSALVETRKEYRDGHTRLYRQAGQF